MSERYEIRKKIGQGGIGAVYKAFDTQLKREVAIKRMLPSEKELKGEEDASAEMLKEATILSSLSHPNIITVYDVGTDNDGAFVVMELLKGETLDETIERGVLTVDDFHEVVTQTLEGLMAAQEVELLHRDLKPTNLMVNWLPTGKFQVKILDFGLAKFTQTPAVQTVEHGDAILGSIYFMAPEQFERAPLDCRTDLYSLGCIYYQALTGQYPFQGETAPQVMASHLQNNYKPIKEIRPDAPDWIANWVGWLISRNASDRPEDAKDALIAYSQAQKAGYFARPNQAGHAPPNVASSTLPGTTPPPAPMPTHGVPRIASPGVPPINTPAIGGSATPAIGGIPAPTPTVGGVAPATVGSTPAAPATVSGTSPAIKPAPVLTVTGAHTTKTPGASTGGVTGPISPAAQPNPYELEAGKKKVKGLTIILIALFVGLLALIGSVIAKKVGKGNDTKWITSFCQSESATGADVKKALGFLEDDGDLATARSVDLEAALASVTGDEVTPAILAYMEKCSNPNTLVRIYQKILAQKKPSGGEVVFEKLATESPDQRVRDLSIESLGRFGNKNGLRPLVAFVGDSKQDPVEVREAIIRLAKRTQVDGSIYTRIDGATPEVRDQLLLIAGELGGNQALAEIKKSLNNPKSKDAALRALQKWPDPKQGPFIKDLFDNEDDPTSQYALFRAYVELATKEDGQEEMYRNAISMADEDTKKREMIAKKIAFVFHDWSTEIATTLSNDPDKKVSFHAKRALKNIAKELKTRESAKKKKTNTQ